MQDTVVDYLVRPISIEQRYIISNRDISSSLQKSLDDSINNGLDRHFIEGFNNGFIVYRAIGGKFLGSAVLFQQNPHDISGAVATLIYTDSPHILLDFKRVAARMQGLDYDSQVIRSLETFKILKDKHILQYNIYPNLENSKMIINKLKAQ